MKICAEALSTEAGCRYASISPVQSPRDDIEVVSTLVYTIFNAAIEKGSVQIPAGIEDFEFAKIFTGMTEKLGRRTIDKS